MNKTPLLVCHFLDTGYCLASEHHLIRGGARKTVHCHALVALLHHPEHGWLLFDTGYAQRMLDATARLPNRLYRALTPLRIDPRLAVVNQLARWDLPPSAIRRVIISHLHADHTAGLRDFPDATITITPESLAILPARDGFAGLRRGIIPSLLPDDLHQRAVPIMTFGDAVLPGLGRTHDLFGDGSLRLVQLPGHARGQIGIYVQTTNGPVLFAADSCWLSRSIAEQRPPARITNLLVDDPRAVKTTINSLHAFATLHPQVRIIPSHCPAAFAREVIPWT